jgi:hypothetical protein
MAERVSDGLRGRKWFRARQHTPAGARAVVRWLDNLTALRNGDPWIGRNYWNQPIDTWGQFIVLVVVTVFGILAYTKLSLVALIRLDQ